MYSLLETVYPDWHMKEFFSTNIMTTAFETDASDSTRSMSSELITTEDINNSFDDIAYDKGKDLNKLSEGRSFFKFYTHAREITTRGKTLTLKKLITFIKI